MMKTKEQRLGRRFEALVRGLWPATRADVRKLLEEVRACRQLLRERHDPQKQLLESLLKALRSGARAEIPETTYAFERVCLDLPVRIPSGPRNEFCVAAVALGDEYRRELEPCLATHRDYSARHGLDYHLLEKAPKNFNDRGPRHPAWAKIALVGRLLREGYRYCLCLDADIAITNPAIAPAELTTLFGPSSADLVVNEEDVFFNTGLILARQTDFVHALLNVIWQNDKYRVEGSWEQDSLLDLINGYPEIRKRIEIVPPRKLQSEPPEYREKFSSRDRYLWQPGDFSMHFVQSTGADRRRLMAKYIKSA